jgi:O-antigen/teichoic acid export membrane protein
MTFLQSLLQASNYFKSVLKKEVVFQISRIIFVPLVVLFAIKLSLSDEIILMLIIFFLAISFLLASLSLFFDFKKIYLRRIIAEKSERLRKKQKSVLKKFILAMAVLSLSGAFFSNIDKIMLGIFVDGSFIGYYTVAFGLIGALTPLIGFASIALLPIFSGLKGERLEAGFKKSIRITMLLSIALFGVTIFLAYAVIFIIFGRDYLLATNILRLLSLLLFVTPAIAIYQSYYVSQNRVNKIAVLLILSIILNIFLNYVFIKAFLPYGYLAALYGAAIATIISKMLYLGGLIFGRKRGALKENGR